MSSTNDVMSRRVRNLRVIVEQWGGPTSLAKKLKLSGPSYISQMVSGVRPITEKTARKFEAQLGLATGWFDINHASDKNAPSLDDSLVTRAITLVGASVNEQHVTIRPDQFAELVSLVYGEAQRSGHLDEQLINRIVGLLK